ncbi:BON domain-containing protein [Dechloromonas denitrificans]|nr:BON domain-containing protein [Dechloromonas denitrificans]
MMQKTKLAVAILALATLFPLLQGCVPAIIAGGAVGVMSAHDRRSTGVQADDETTEWKAAQRVPEKFKAFSHLNFTSYNHRVLITGEVPSEEAKNIIGEQTRQVEGVKEVFNEVNIAAASALGNRSNDSYITSKLKARLVDSNQLSANHVKVVTENGVAYLMGIVNDREAKVAIAIARTTDGVRRVVSIMEVVAEADTRRIDSSSVGGARNVPAQTAPVETR